MHYETPEELEAEAEESSPSAKKTVENSSKREDMQAFLAEFAAKPGKPDESRLMKDAVLDREEKDKNPELWEKTLERSKEKAREILQFIPALDANFQKYPDSMLSIKIGGDGEQLNASVVHGEIDHNALDSLQSLLNDCGEIRIPSRFYGADADCIRFAGLLGGQSISSISPIRFLEMLKEALESAEELE